LVIEAGGMSHDEKAAKDAERARYLSVWERRVRAAFHPRPTNEKVVC
jgi:very-short-patch-repair endonuclease